MSVRNTNPMGVGVSVVQLGARMHYAVPRILQSAGLLAHLYTDAHGGDLFLRPLMSIPDKWKPPALRKLLGRNIGSIPAEKVTSFPSVSLQYRRRLMQASAFSGEEAAAHLGAGAALASKSIHHGVDQAKSVYAFNSASLELFRFAKSRGMNTFYEQTIAPVKTEWKLLDEERNGWPGWEGATQLNPFYAPFEDVEQQEWKLADLIICGSPFVHDAIKSRSPQSNVVIVPYGVDAGAGPKQDRTFPSGRKFRVLTVGAVGLRKGAPYVGEVAKRLSSECEFRWAGGFHLQPEGLRALGAHVQLIGAIPRQEMARQYQWADAFFLPSICEGSATVTYEAIQAGLPLVVTPNSGAPLPCGHPGFVPIRDVDRMVSMIGKLASDADYWQSECQRSQQLAGTLTVDAYGKRLLSAIAVTHGNPSR